VGYPSDAPVVWERASPPNVQHTRELCEQS
jgi:hypothetical protein